MSAAGARTTRPVDLTHLATYTGGDSALNAEVLQLFLDQSAKMMRQLQTVIEAGDQKTWREITHSLKGAARGIGAFALGDAAAQAEPVVVADNATAAIEALQALAASMRAVHLFIEAYLGR